MPRLILPLLLTFCLLFISQASGRTWTRKDGKTAEGKALAVKADKVTVSLSNNRKAEISIQSLTLEDQQFLKTWKPKPPKRPIQVPPDAIYHSGSWYGIVVEKTS